MRGKKNAFENYVDYYMDPDMDFDKRAPMGFQGMRGKKDSDKRAPMGFQGMRGKRNTGQRFDTGMDFETRTSNEYQGNRCSLNVIYNNREKGKHLHNVFIDIHY